MAHVPRPPASTLTAPGAAHLFVPPQVANVLGTDELGNYVRPEGTP